MLNLNLQNTKEGRLKVLCLGAHSDDIEIGCGGTILRMLLEYPKMDFFWVVFSANSQRAEEARRSAARFLKRSERQRIVTKNFRDGFFPYIGGEIKDCFEEIKGMFVPDLVFTHHFMDRHQDHRLICDLTWNTFRNHLILEYEIPKYEGDLGHPNFFVPLSESLCRRKLKLLQDSFPSQHDNHWFTEETFLSILRVRGIESNAPGKYAEAFHCRKMVI